MTQRTALAFVLTAYLISWAIFAVGKWGFGLQPGLAWAAMSALFMLGPALAAVLLRKRVGLSWKDLGVVRTGIQWKWMGIAVLIAMALPPLTLFFNWLLGNWLQIGSFGHTAISKAMVLSVIGDRLAAGGSSGQGSAAMDRIAALPLNGAGILLLVLLAGAVAGCTVNFIFAMGEELGWRGMLFHATRRWGLWKQVLFTGLVWGLWHAPLILEGHNYPEHRVAGMFMMCLLTTALAIPMAWVRLRSGCVWSAGVLHGTLNGVAGGILLFTQGASSLAGGAAGVSIVLALVVITGLLFLCDAAFPKQFTPA